MLCTWFYASLTSNIWTQVLGALWYLLSIERQYTCWVTECSKENGTMGLPLCNPSFLDCSSLELPERKAWLNSSLVRASCDATSSSVTFNFGMFADALNNEIVAATFLEKYLYCLWWGLRNLRLITTNSKTPIWTSNHCISYECSISWFASWIVLIL